METKTSDKKAILLKKLTELKAKRQARRQSARPQKNTTRQVMLDRRLSIECKAIYAYLKQLSGKGKQCSVRTKKICYDLNISDNRLFKHRKQLVSAGYIKVIKQGRTNLYFLGGGYNGYQ